MQTSNYSTIIVDLGSGFIKAGFGGEDGPRSIFSSLIGIPKMPGLMVGMEQKEQYVGDEAISKLEIMNFISPIQRGEITDWDKFDTLLHYLFYNEMKIVPEEISILITESPLSSKENRQKLTEVLFETFNVEKIHIANSSMLGLYSYGKTSGLVVDSGFNVTSSVPVYEGYPLTHASLKMNVGGEDLSKNLLDMIKDNIDPNYKLLKGRILADDIKEKLAYVLLNKDDAGNDNEEYTYKLPDEKTINLSSELYKCCDCLFNPECPVVNEVENVNVNNNNENAAEVNENNEEEDKKEEEEKKEEDKKEEEEKKEEEKKDEEKKVEEEEKNERPPSSHSNKSAHSNKSKHSNKSHHSHHSNKSYKRAKILSVKDMVLESINKCDSDIINDIRESICLIGGNTLLKNFSERLKNEISDSNEGGNFKMNASSERQFSAWIGGSIVASLDNFQYMWVSKQEFDENGKNLLAVDSKCF